MIATCCGLFPALLIVSYAFTFIAPDRPLHAGVDRCDDDER